LLELDRLGRRRVRRHFGIPRRHAATALPPPPGAAAEARVGPRSVGLPILLLLAAIVAQAARLDLGAFVLFNQLAGAAPDWIWQVLTVLGDSGIVICALAPALLLRPQWVMAVLAAVPMASLFSYAMKSLFHGAPRPGAVLDPAHFHLVGQLFQGNSFPSGHSITAFAVAAAILTVERRPQCVRLATALLGLALAVACSRVAVGAHWPVDVMAGAAGGWLCGVLGAVLVRRYPGIWLTTPWKNGAAVVFVLLACWIAALDTGYALARPLQWAAVVAALAAASWQLLAASGFPQLRRLR
jgi:membrane-associated phospholipid phosphatase